MSDLSVNQPKIAQPDMKQENAVETGGVIANASGTPSPLFSPASSCETGGSIASNSSSSSSSGGGSVSYTC